MLRAFAAVALALLPLARAPAADAPPQPITATTESGDRVILHPNGRWEYVDTGKATEAKKVADQFPENQARPVEAQGGLFGIGRTIMPGDKDYNRGSLNPKQR
jgi:hypothetical protein